MWLNLEHVKYYFSFLLAVILIYNASQGYALIISAAFNDRQLAVTLTPVLIIPFMLFAGFFVSTSQIPWFMTFPIKDRCEGFPLAGYLVPGCDGIGVRHGHRLCPQG